MALLNLGQFFKDTEIADVIFVVEDKEIHGHRFAFANACPYFKNLLFGHFRESKTHKVQINGTSFKLFQEIMRFVYLRQLEVKDWNTEDLVALLSKAHEYQYDALVSEVVKVLEVHPVNLDSWPLVNASASIYESDLLKRKCALFVEDKIDDFLCLKDLQKFTAELICLMFESSKISTVNQDQLLGAILKWKQNHDATQIVSIFPKISWNKVSPNITDVVIKELFFVVQNPPELKCWTEVGADIPEPFVATVDRLSLIQWTTVELSLSNYPCSLLCRLESGFIGLWFKKENSDFEIPVIRVEWESVNDYTIDRAYGVTNKWGEEKMVWSKSTTERNCFQYCVMNYDSRPVYCICIYSKQFEDLSVNISKLAIYSLFRANPTDENCSNERTSNNLLTVRVSEQNE